MPLREKLHVMIEVGEQNVVTKLAERDACVPRKPVLNDLATRIHRRNLTVLITQRTKKTSDRPRRSAKTK
jgi:hypothetical protein